MKILNKALCAIATIALFSSCASIVSKSNWPLTINTNPNGVNVEITNHKRIVVYKGNSPMTTKLKSAAGFFEKESYSVKLSMEGYQEKVIPVSCNLNGWYFGNILFGGLIGLLIVDPATGAMYRLDTETINETLTAVTPSTASTEPSLQILNINDIDDTMKQHLVSIK